MDIIKKQEEMEAYANPETRTYEFKERVEFRCDIITPYGWSIKAGGDINVF